jgi:hypothetical protein
MTLDHDTATITLDTTVGLGCPADVITRTVSRDTFEITVYSKEYINSILFSFPK